MAQKSPGAEEEALQTVEASGLTKGTVTQQTISQEGIVSPLVAQKAPDELVWA